MGGFAVWPVVRVCVFGTWGVGVGVNVAGRMACGAYGHVVSALARVAGGGRVVTSTGAGVSPDAPAWREAFARLQEQGRIVFTAAIDGAIYAKNGTTIDTRLTVIEKAPDDTPTTFPESRGLAPDSAALMDRIRVLVAAQRPINTPGTVPPISTAAPPHQHPRT